MRVGHNHLGGFERPVESRYVIATYRVDRPARLHGFTTEYKALSYSREFAGRHGAKP